MGAHTNKHSNWHYSGIEAVPSLGLCALGAAFCLGVWMKTRFQKFWEKVDTNSNPEGCWEWTAHIKNTGYGQFGPRNRGAHRVSWEMHFGAIPPGLLVCHHCDNRRCVRPDHLFVGTATDNLRDAARKGRTATGNRNHNAKLSDREVEELRGIGRRISQRKLARMYGVSQTTIRDSQKGATWRHVVGRPEESDRGGRMYLTMTELMILIDTCRGSLSIRRDDGNSFSYSHKCRDKLQYELLQRFDKAKVGVAIGEGT